MSSEGIEGDVRRGSELQVGESEYHRKTKVERKVRRETMRRRALKTRVT